MLEHLVQGSYGIDEDNERCLPATATLTQVSPKAEM